MGDWPVAVAIVLVAIVWIQIFVDYRRKLVRLMPGFTAITARKEQMTTRISEAESELETLKRSQKEMREEIERLEKRRVNLQEELNPLEMVSIPAGTVAMGTNPPGPDDENPQHLVSVGAFYMDQYEVTNLQYKEFIEATNHRVPSHWRNRAFPDANLHNHPVVNVSWRDAVAFAEWVGKRLPTEAEWERAALGDGRYDYPWGRSCLEEAANYDNPQGKTTAVDRHELGKSPLGVHDMCGNVGEWVHDWYDSKYYQHSPESDPQGPDNGYQRIFRGGGYHENRMGIRGRTRDFQMPEASNDYVGFRCVMDHSS